MKKLYFLLSALLPVLTVIFLYHALGMDSIMNEDESFSILLGYLLFVLSSGIAVVFEIDWIYSAFYFFTKTWKKARWKTVLNIVAVSLTFLSILSIGDYLSLEEIPLELKDGLVLMCLSFHFITRVAYIILLIIEKCSQSRTVRPDAFPQ